MVIPLIELLVNASRQIPVINSEEKKIEEGMMMMLPPEINPVATVDSPETQMLTLAMIRKGSDLQTKWLMIFCELLAK
jgi:hypothetical protein